MRLSLLLIALMVPPVLMAPQVSLAQADVSPKLVYAERYLEKGWYRDAWELIEPMLPQSAKDMEDSSSRLLVAAIEALYGLHRVGDAMNWIETLNKLEASGKMGLSESQAQRKKAVEAEILKRFGTLRFVWPRDGGKDVKPIQQFTLEWAGEEAILDEDLAAFEEAFRRVGGPGVQNNDRVYLPKGRVAVNGIWKEITDQEQVFLVSEEKPPKYQRADNGDGIGFALGVQGLPGYNGPSYDDLYWQDKDLDPDDPAYVGISSRRFGLSSMPRFEFSATHSLITQGWREIGLKGFVALSPGLGGVGNIPEGDEPEDLPDGAPYFTMGVMARQSFHASQEVLIALGIGLQGLYTPRMRFVAQGIDQGDSPYCVTSTSADLFIVDRRTLGAGVLGSFEASRAVQALNARIGLETTAGYNLAAPLPANRVSLNVSQDELPDDLDGNEICFEDEGIVLGGFDLRAQFFFRIALW